MLCVGIDLDNRKKKLHVRQCPISGTPLSRGEKRGKPPHWGRSSGGHDAVKRDEQTEGCHCDSNRDLEPIFLVDLVRVGPGRQKRRERYSQNAGSNIGEL